MIETLTLSELCKGRPPLVMAPHDTIAAAVVAMRARHVSSVAVVEHDSPVGLFTEADALRLLASGLYEPGAPLSERMSAAPLSVSESQSFVDGYARMAGQGYRHLLLTDPHGRLTGIVSETDFAQALGADELLVPRTIADLMTPNPVTLPPRAPVAEALTLMSERRISSVVIVEAGAPVGILTERDAIRLAEMHVDLKRVAVVTEMSHPLHAITPERPAHEATPRMRQHQVRHLIVRQPGGPLLGILTRRDLLKDIQSVYVRLLQRVVAIQGHALRDAERKLGEQGMLRLILDNSSVGMTVRNTQGEIILANPAMRRLLGYSQDSDALIRRHYRDLSAPEDRNREESEFQQLLTGTTSHYRLEKGYLHCSGQVIHADVTVTAIRDSSGELTQALAIVTDISELRRAQSHLLEAQAVAHLGSWEYEPSTDRIQCSDETYRILGISPGVTLDASPLSELIHPEERQRVTRAFRRVFRRGGSIDLEHRLRDRDGAECWVRVRAVARTGLLGQLIQVIGTVQDITEEHAVQRQQRLANTLFENTSEGIMITDANNHIIAVNPTFTATTGYSAAEVIGQNPRMLASGRHDASFYQALWEQLLRTDAWTGEICNRRKNGELYPQRLTINLVKDDLGQIVQHLGTFSDLSDVQRSADAIAFLSRHDALTGLPNLNTFSDALRERLEQLDIARNPLALFVLDLKHFGDVVSFHGHLAADAALQEIGRRLTAMARPTDLVARLAGDRFAVARALEMKLDTAVQAVQGAERLQQIVHEPMQLADIGELTVAANLGVAVYPDDGASAHTLIRNAESALAQTKQGNSATIAFYRPQLTQAARRRIQLENELRQALSRHELRLFYQPIISVESGRIVAAEALLRWAHPHDGLLVPRDFIDVVERSELVHSVGRWVLQQAASQARDWQEQGHPVRVSINVAGHQISAGHLAHEINDTLQQTGLDPQLLSIEVLERVLLHDPEQALAELRRVRELGVSIALDDFGSGYSSLSYLKLLPVQTLKIDRGFIRHLTSDPVDEAIVRSTIDMAHRLQLQVVAEGVEKTEQFEYLAQSGCDLAQGYLFGRPGEPDALVAAITARER